VQVGYFGDHPHLRTRISVGGGGQRDIGLFSPFWHDTRDGFNIVESREASPLPMVSTILVWSS
jgi:hypothetical protein